MLVTSIFSFCHIVFCCIKVSKREILILATNLSSANAFNLVTCKILLFGKGLKQLSGDDEQSDKKSQRSVKSSGSKLAVSAFGSVTAQMSDGMTLALSQFGSSGEAPESN